MIIALISCKKDDLPSQPNYSAVHSYDEAIAHWNSFNYHNYILYQHYDGWGPGLVGPVRLLIRSDTIAEIRLVSNDSLLDYSWQRFQTVVQLFNQVDYYRNMDTSRYVFSVAFDSLYGYPKIWHVYIKPPPTDFSIGHSSWNLQPL
jgi:hypothetical protein